MKLSVTEVCGSDFISRDAGKIFRNEILKNWNCEEIEIIIGNTPIGSASFFDEAFALLLKRENKTPEEIRKKLKFTDITSEDKKLLNYVMMARMTEKNTPNNF